MNRFLTVRWRLAAAFFLVILVLLSLTGLYLLDWTEGYYVRLISNDLRRESQAMAGLVQAAPQDMSDVVTNMGHDLGHRITIIRSNGRVLADSESNFRRMPNHSNRPEFRQALAIGYGTSTRYSATLKTKMLYVATSYGPRRDPSGVVRIAEPLSGLDELMTAIQRTFILAGLAAILAAAALSLKLASGITDPIESIASTARKLAQGDLNARVSAQPKTSGELGELASTFNVMAEQLQSNVDEMNRQSARMQAVFDHTDNGLILVDPEDRIRMINPAACRILGIGCPETIQKTLIEGTLSHDLAGLVERVRRTHEPAALDVDLLTTNERAVHAYVAPVPRPDSVIDVLVVLHDVTSMRKLDTIRRDFVANVSHELRTPLASIKAMAETIMLRHATNPDAVPGFAESIVQEADRMTLLAEDLLDLARIESQRRDAVVESLRLRGVVDGVFDRLTRAAEKKSISLENEVKAEEVIDVESDPLVQILMNLVDNAIKYTPEAGTVKIWADHTPEHIAIRVSDSGIGIPTEDLSRIFERFYRVDKARSRESGGTGLGLAIVKHICEQMGGSISVKSEIGTGSTFSILLPAGQITDDAESF
ncbi:MAG: ATP-binding protein [Armatimonadota bacterium]|nr:HAMP domain-containing protein [bacterium]